MTVKPFLPRILIILPLKLWPVSNGGQTRVLELVKWLNAQHLSVEIVTLSYDWVYFERISAYVDRIWVLNSHHINRQTAACPFSKSRYPGLKNLVELIVEFIRPIAVMAQFTDTAHVLSDLPAETLRILDTIDVHYLRKQAYTANAHQLDYPCRLEDEIACWQLADVVIAIQKDEAAFIRDHCPSKRVITIGHAHGAPDPLATPLESQSILFVGNLGPPNIDGIAGFIEHAWPIIKRDAPTWQLDVCGRVCKADLPSAPGVIFHGLVDDIRVYYQNAAMVINPVTYGSGQNVKTVEALAFGKCLVSTAYGTRHLPASDVSYCRIADSYPAMAHEILQLIDRPALRRILEHQGITYMKHHLIADVAYQELRAVLDTSEENDDQANRSPTPDPELPERIITGRMDCYTHPARFGASLPSPKAVKVMMCFPKMDPPDDWANLHKGTYLARTARYEEAFACFDTIAPESGHYMEMLGQKGGALAVLGRYRKALECFVRVEQEHTENAQVKLSISDTLKYMGEYRRALEKISEAERIEPENPNIGFKRRLIHGLQLRESHRFDEALNCFNRIPSKAPNYIEAQFQKGLLFNRLGNIQAARTCFDIVRSNPINRLDVEQTLNSFYQRNLP